MKEFSIQAVLQYKNKPILVNIYIRDGIVIADFTNKKVGRMIYENEKRNGKNVKYDNLKEVLIENYPGKTAEEILKKIKEELKQGGGKEVDKS